MGVAYIQIMLRTPHRNCVSRKKTIEVDNKSPKPRLKIIMQHRKYRLKTTDLLKETSVKVETINNGINEILRLMTEDITRVRG